MQLEDKIIVFFKKCTLYWRLNSEQTNHESNSGFTECAKEHHMNLDLDSSYRKGKIYTEIIRLQVINYQTTKL